MKLCIVFIDTSIITHVEYAYVYLNDAMGALDNI